MTTEALVIETKNLNFSYRKNETFIEDLNLKVPQGSIYGFLGANGAGKSTTIRLLTGLLKSKNAIHVLGESIAKPSKNIFARMGVLIEDASLYEHLTARQNLAIVCNYHKISKFRIEEVLTIVNLDDSNKKVKHYSMGMKQRLGLAMALLPNPELLILDEPVNGLDPHGIKEIRELLINLNQCYGTSIFLSSHLLSEIEKICTHVGIIKQGKMVFQGKIAELETHKRTTLVETPNVSETLRIIEKSGRLGTIVDENFVSINLDDRNQIPALINQLVDEQVKIYSIQSKKETLEEWFMEISQ